MADQGINPCGKTTCLELVYAAIFRMGWQAAAVVALLLIAAPNLVLALIQAAARASSGSTTRSDAEIAASSAALWSPSYSHALFCRGPYGACSVDDNVIDLQQQQHQSEKQRGDRRGWTSAAIHYSPVMRMRKSAYFKQPLDMIEDAVDECVY